MNKDSFKKTSQKTPKNGCDSAPLKLTEKFSVVNRRKIKRPNRRNLGQNLFGSIILKRKNAFLRNQNMYSTEYLNPSTTIQNAYSKKKYNSGLKKGRFCQIRT